MNVLFKGILHGHKLLIFNLVHATEQHKVGYIKRLHLLFKVHRKLIFLFI